MKISKVCGNYVDFTYGDIIIDIDKETIMEHCMTYIDNYLAVPVKFTGYREINDTMEWKVEICNKSCSHRYLIIALLETLEELKNV